ARRSGQRRRGGGRHPGRGGPSRPLQQPEGQRRRHAARRPRAPRVPDPAAVGRARRFAVPAGGSPDRRDPRGRRHARPAPHSQGRPLVSLRERAGGQSPDAGVLRVMRRSPILYGWWVPFGLAGTGPVVAAGVVARWFSKRRGTALSVLGSASMTGMSLLVPAVTWLIITTGWRTSYVVMAGGILVLVLPLCLWVV